MSAALFTASQIATALGKTPQAVRQQLAMVEHSGMSMCGGNQAKTYAMATLPPALLSALEFKALAAGYRNAETLIASPLRAWCSSVPLAEVAQHCLDKAAKLQRALSRCVALRNNTIYSAAEIEQMVVADYARELGHTISERHVRDLMKRTLDRAGSEGNFDRLELYLDESPARKVTARPVIAAAVQDEFAELLAVAQGFKDAAAPSSAEKTYLWLRAFELYDEKLDAGQPVKATRLNLRRFLIRNAPWLAKNAETLRVIFRQKYDAWLASDRQAAALRDGRHEKSGHYRAPELSADDRDKIIGHAVLKCGGRVSQAWRELSEANALSENLLSQHTATPASKSYVPATIREAVKYEAAMLDDIHHGPRTAKLNGAHLLRNWDTVAPMDWLCADDCTLEVYFYIPDGKGWFSLTRGQLLLLIDLRTTRILGYALLPEKSYNARAIRTLITKVADEHGLPRKGFYFERGIWEKSRLLKGDPNAQPFSNGEVEVGLRGLGLDFVHSRLPRSKPVERVLGQIQDYMDGEPGFVGGNEMKEKFERVQQHKLLVDRQAEHPSKFFRDLDQWNDRLAELCSLYNSARNDGKMTGGLSPDDAFVKFANTQDPLTRLPPSCRYLLSHHKRPVPVTRNGITLRFGKQVYNYRNEQTGQLIGQQVLAWFNPEMPEILTVTDMKRANPFCIERTQELPAMNAPTELIEQEMARVAAHNSYAKTRYKILKAKNPMPFRGIITTAATVELGREMNAQAAEMTQRQADESKRVTRLQKTARNAGIVLSPGAMRRPETLAAAADLKELLNLKTDAEGNPL